jgi:hypothetical protein
MGRPIAYIGYQTHCPKCKGTYPIVEGVIITTFYGMGVVVAGMKTACGAVLLANQAGYHQQDDRQEEKRQGDQFGNSGSSQVRPHLCFHRRVWRDNLLEAQSGLYESHRREGLQVKALSAGLLLGVLSAQAGARPSPAVVDACLRTESVPPEVRYISITADAFQVTEDEEAGKTNITLQHGPDTIGTWEIKKPQAFGLVFNGKEMPLARVTRLDKRKLPAVFNPYEAIWGEAREGSKSYICATFSFDGLGKSGSFQNMRGLYLIERHAYAGATFYASGNIAVSKK